MWNMKNARQSELSNPRARSLKRQLAQAQRRLKSARDPDEQKRHSDTIENIRKQLSK